MISNFLKILFLSLAFILAACGGKSAKGAEIEVVGFSRTANYALTHDSRDAAQLTDGLTMSGPMWMHRSAVGWQELSPIVIDVAFKSFLPTDGLLRFHVGSGASADVRAPVQIAVYGVGVDRLYRRVGRVWPIDEAKWRANSYWIEVPIVAISEQLAVVIHSSGAYIFLDEVEWRAGNTESSIDVEPVIGDRQAVLNDAVASVNGLLSQKADNRAAQVAHHEAPENFEVRVVNDPWGDLSTETTAYSAAFDVQGLSTEKESVCVEVFGAQTITDREVFIEVEGAPSGATALFSVGSVVAENAQRVFDPLLPLRSDGLFSLDGGRRKFLWIRFDIGRFGNAVTEVRVIVRSNIGTKLAVITGTVRAYVADKAEQKKNIPTVNVWSYLSDLPIVGHRDEAMADLVSGGVNVFVVPPGDIPGVELDGSWDIEALHRFRETVSIFRGRGKVLLFLKWQNNEVVSVLSGSRMSTSQEREVLKDWLIAITSELDRLGVSRDDWALYPIDEPHGETLQALSVIARNIKHIDKRIRIYANPTLSKDIHHSESVIQALLDVVDEWQPNISLVDSSSIVREMVADRKWSIYVVPKLPAKTASPVGVFRLLSWGAWNIGASGVGFWSYSDTGNSSAWIDVDGRRPDWAVVYESANGVVGSRRWDAFRDGIEDFRLLSSFDRKLVTRLIHDREVVMGRPLEAWRLSDIEFVRQELLKKRSDSL